MAKSAYHVDLCEQIYRNTEKAKEKRKIKWEKSKLQNVVELRD